MTMQSKMIIGGFLLFGAIVVAISEPHQHGNEEGHTHESTQLTDGADLGDCSIIGRAYNTTLTRLGKLSADTEMTPASSVITVFQEIGHEASVQAIFSPFENDEPGDRATVAISETGPVEAAQDFLNHDNMKGIPQSAENKEVSDFYCAAHRVGHAVGTANDHLAVIFTVEPEGRAVEVQYSPDTERDDTVYQWDVETVASAQASIPLKDVFCDLVEEDFKETDLSVVDECRP